jgi:hypothetical protein
MSTPSKKKSRRDWGSGVDCTWEFHPDIEYSSDYTKDFIMWHWKPLLLWGAGWGRNDYFYESQFSGSWHIVLKIPQDLLAFQKSQTA